MSKCKCKCDNSGLVCGDCGGDIDIPKIQELQAEINLVRGAMAADDKRLLSAGQRVGIYFGCDTPDIMADEIIQSRAEIARLKAELKTTDGLLKEATETIGSVIACCTYDSNNDAKIGIYGIDHKAFTKIDQFITHYNDAVSAGKVSIDVKPVKRENDYQNDNRTNTGG